MNARVFAALLVRDVVVARREVGTLLVRAALQPVLFVVVFGYILPSIRMIPDGYSTTIMPGVAALCVTMASIWAVALPLISDFGFTKEIEDRLLAPVPTELIAIEKVVSGIFQGIFAALIVLPLARLIMGPVPGLSYGHPFLLALMVIMACATFSSLGLYCGTAMQPQQVSIMMSVLFVPMIMFGCAYFPWRGLDRVPVLQYAVLIDPLVYVSEGLRAALTPGVPHMPLPAILGALALLTTFFLTIGLRAFLKRAVT